MGIQSAKRQGLRCVGITTSYPAAELGEADAVVGRLDELTLESLEQRRGARGVIDEEVRQAFLQAAFSPDEAICREPRCCSADSNIGRSIASLHGDAHAPWRLRDRAARRRRPPRHASDETGRVEHACIYEDEGFTGNVTRYDEPREQLPWRRSRSQDGHSHLPGRRVSRRSADGPDCSSRVINFPGHFLVRFTGCGASGSRAPN